jgi:hypothetical protein
MMAGKLFNIPIGMLALVNLEKNNMLRKAHFAEEIEGWKLDWLLAGSDQ